VRIEWEDSPQPQGRWQWLADLKPPPRHGRGRQARAHSGDKVDHDPHSRGSQNQPYSGSASPTLAAASAPLPVEFCCSGAGGRPRLMGRPCGYVLRLRQCGRAQFVDLRQRNVGDDDRTLNRIHHALYVQCRELAAREASPTAAIIDGQSAESAEKGGPASIRMATMPARKSKARSGISW